MKEFVLTQPYASLEEMLNSAEVAVYKEELQQGNIEKYAIVSRIGNRYDINGNKIEDFVDNPFVIPVVYKEITREDVFTEVNMKYLDIEALIDKEIEKAVSEEKAKHQEEIALLNQNHALELEKAKSQVIAEVIAKLNS